MVLYFELSKNCFVKVSGYNKDDILYKLNMFFKDDLNHLNCINEQTFKDNKYFQCVLTIV